jgi:hypothetical protein
LVAFRGVRMTSGRLEGARVLIAEDEALLGWEMTGMLEDEGADVVGPVSSIGEGMACVSEYRSQLDAAVLDWRLIDGTARPLAETLAKYAVPFVFFTADDLALRKEWPRARVLSKLQAPLVVPCLVGVLAGRRGPYDLALQA